MTLRAGGNGGCISLSGKKTIVVHGVTLGADGAVATGGKPAVMEVRLKNLKDKRMLGVLKAATQAFRWTPKTAPSGRGFGVACGVDAGTYVALLAEVEVDRDRGKVQVKRVVCAQDMGLAINPEGAKVQMEGCITMGLGYALAEEIRFQGGRILDRNFGTYRISTVC